MDKPRLLLDVDGVLCPFDEAEGYHRHDLVSTGSEGAWISVLDGWVWIAEANTERLQQLQRTFTLTWATAWEDHANDCLLEPHGLEDPLEVIRFDYSWATRDELNAVALAASISADSSGLHSWKLPWIRLWAERDGRPLAWVDDDVGPDTMAWTEERTASGIPTLAIRIDPVIGLTDDHVQELEEWWENASEKDGDGSRTPVLPVREETEAGTNVSEEAE